MIKPSEILYFWFQENSQEQWFGKTNEFDEEIRRRYLEITHKARRGDLDPWAQSPNSTLALIILIDQFSRNLFRNSPMSWSADAYCLDITKQALYKSYDDFLNDYKRAFMYLPLMHSESLEDQDQCVELVKKTLDNGIDFNKDNYDAAVRHRYIIARFGRFPHRNEVLGRNSTLEEIEFLKEPNSSF